jgi:hypothetical protein
MIGAGIISLLVLFFVRRTSQGKAMGRASLYACFITGYSEMTLNVLLILSFQILYGSVYYEIVILITGYMVGLILGSWHMTRRLEALGRPLQKLVLIQAGLALYAVALVGIIVFFHRVSPQSALALAIEVGFSLLTLGAGYFGGLHFPLTSAIYLAGKSQVGKSASLVYGMDLIGSAIGALSAGVILLPVFGITSTLFFIAALNLSAFLLLGSVGLSRRFV